MLAVSCLNFTLTPRCADAERIAPQRCKRSELKHEELPAIRAL